jgi:hypothetical protein
MTSNTPTSKPSQTPTISIDLASLATFQGIKVYGAAMYDWSSYSVSPAGDVNGDGFADIIIGAYQADLSSRGFDTGTSYVIYGSSTPVNIDLLSLSSAQGFAIYGAAVYDYSGFSVSTAGDINGDGFDDVIIGAYGVDPSSRTDAGTSYVIYGSSTPVNIDLLSLSSAQGFAIYGAASGDKSGYSVSHAGDVNGDFFSDIIIGAYQADPSSRSNAGASYVIYGSSAPTNIDLSSLSSTQGFAVYGAAAYDNSGFSVSSAGDINNDDFDDIIIGAQSADPSSRSGAGISYVIYGSSTPTNIDLLSLSSAQGFAIYGAAAGDNSGFSVSSAGDINNDGFDDIIIGAPYADPSSRSSAGIYLCNLWE